MRLTRRGRLSVTLLVLLLVVGGGGYLLLRTPVGTLAGVTAGPACTLTASGRTVEWSAEQAMTATTAAGVGTRTGATLNGVAAAVDRSLARLDRRDGSGPLGPADVRDVYRALPDAATPGDRALDVAEALLGRRGAALTCVLPLSEPDLPAQRPNDLGLTPRADRVRTELRAVFGKQILGGFSPEGVSTGHIDGSAHYSGRAIDVFHRPATEANQRRGRQQALWAVAHAERLRVATVIFDRRIWTARRSVQGWHDYRPPGGRTDNPVLLHEDHVHVDVLAGG
jgi:hypothetical protein